MWVSGLFGLGCGATTEDVSGTSTPTDESAIVEGPLSEGGRRRPGRRHRRAIRHRRRRRGCGRRVADAGHGWQLTASPTSPCPLPPSRSTARCSRWASPRRRRSPSPWQSRGSGRPDASHGGARQHPDACHRLRARAGVRQQGAGHLLGRHLSGSARAHPAHVRRAGRRRAWRGGGRIRQPRRPERRLLPGEQRGDPAGGPCDPPTTWWRRPSACATPCSSRWTRPTPTGTQTRNALQLVYDYLTPAHRRRQRHHGRRTRYLRVPACTRCRHRTTPLTSATWARPPPTPRRRPGALTSPTPTATPPGCARVTPSRRTPSYALSQSLRAYNDQTITNRDVLFLQSDDSSP